MLLLSYLSRGELLCIKKYDKCELVRVKKRFAFNYQYKSELKCVVEQFYGGLSAWDLETKRRKRRSGNILLLFNDLSLCICTGLSFIEVTRIQQAKFIGRDMDAGRCHFAVQSFGL